MKDFDYFTPKTAKEAVSLLVQLKGEGKIFAGGQSLLVLMKQNMIAPEAIVDIKGLSELTTSTTMEGTHDWGTYYASLNREIACHPEELSGPLGDEDTLAVVQT
jgi:CO/xanthine dehydrogenase FAD-binding subunit